MIVRWLLRTFFPDANRKANNWLCRWGLHRWNAALAECEECGLPDPLFTQPKDGE